MAKSPAPSISGSGRWRVLIGVGGLAALLGAGFSSGHKLAGADPTGTPARPDRAPQIIAGP